MLVSNKSISGLEYTLVPRDGKVVFKTYHETFDTPLYTLISCKVTGDCVDEKNINAKINAKMNCYNEIEGSLKPIYVRGDDDPIHIKDFDDTYGDEYIISDIVLDRIVEPGKYMLVGQEGRYLRIKKYYKNEVITFHELHRRDVPWSEHQNIIKQLKYDHTNGGLELFPMHKYEMELVKEQLIDRVDNELSIFVTRPSNLAKHPFQAVFQIECSIETTENYEFIISYVSVPKSYVESYLRQNSQNTEGSTSEGLQDN